MGMNGIKNFFNFSPGYLQNDFETPSAEPRFGLAQPKTRRAKDVIQYLWEEAQYSGESAVDRIMAEYSENCVYEDMTYKDSVFARGFDAVKKYLEEVYANAPEGLRWVIDEFSDGDRACTVVWHIEFAGQKKRGVSFYELDQAGKVCYVRA